MMLILCQNALSMIRNRFFMGGIYQCLTFLLGFIRNLVHVLINLELLIIGTGSVSEKLPKFIFDHISSLGIQLEVCNSRSAVKICNILASEGRTPAAALLPLIPTSARTGKQLVDVKSNN